MIKNYIYQIFSKHSLLFSLFITPFYLFRFIFFAIKNQSLRCLRYYPGHFASTIPSLRDIRKNTKTIFSKNNKECGGIDLYLKVQERNLDSFLPYYTDFKFPAEKTLTYRYHSENSFFRFSDAFILYSMLRQYKPKNVIEIGSGYSSSLFLDVNENNLNNSIHLTFIEPNPSILNELLKNNDAKDNIIINKSIHDVPNNIFKQLGENDFLFIDTSHVLKIGSDLSKIFFEILPLLNDKVIIHVHDIFWPFEYPESTIGLGRIWNEVYLLRAFLQFNSSYKILYFNSYMETHYSEIYKEKLPSCYNNPGGSIWLQKDQK